MKSRADIRLECLKLANVLANTKAIKAADIIAQAQKYLDWVEERHKDDPN